MTLIADELDEYHQLTAYKGLRDARRRQRLAHLDKFDAFYKAYLTGLLAVVGTVTGSRALGDNPLTGSQLDFVSAHGASIVGVFVAVALAIALRSGGRGGPLAFERPEVRHVLMAPVDKRVSIRQPAALQLRHVAVISGAVGALMGVVASHRFDQPMIQWIGALAVFTLVTTVASFGVAMIISGLKVKRSIADALALVALVWSGADAWWQLRSSPMTWIGGVALWPLSFDWLGLLGLALAVPAAAFGLVFINRSSIEAAERRSRLIGQLRFAATTQDVRTVMVLQRQLSLESTRSKPWLRMRPSRRTGLSRAGRPSTSVFVRRSWAGILRWSIGRCVRVILFVALAWACVIGIWGGTSILIVPAGVLLWLAALDLVEALAQEADHPLRTDTAKFPVGDVYFRLLVVPFIVLFVLLMIGFICVWALAPEPDVVSNLGPVVVLAVVGALGGAGIAVVRRPGDRQSTMIETPETAGVKMAFRIGGPPGVAVVALIPLIAARNNWHRTHDVKLMVSDMGVVLIACTFIAMLPLMWLRIGASVSRFVVNPPTIPTAEEQAKKDAKKQKVNAKAASSKNKNSKGKKK